MKKLRKSVGPGHLTSGLRNHGEPKDAEDPSLYSMCRVSGLDGRNGLLVSGPRPFFLSVEKGYPVFLPIAFPELPYGSSGFFCATQIHCEPAQPELSAVAPRYSLTTNSLNAGVSLPETSTKSSLTGVVQLLALLHYSYYY